MTQHTQGPWIITNGRCIYGNGDFIKPFVASVEDDHNDAETEANARLIAAAPDLLAALQAIVTGNVYGNPTQWNLAIDRGIAALAKATGEAQ
jgi:hypothetical protein